jgi:hypothetical protein
MDINRGIEEGQGADELRAGVEILEAELAKREGSAG